MAENDQEKQPGDLDRADVVRMGGLALGAIYGLSAIGPYINKAFATELIGEDDAVALNFLLPFEYLQRSLYEGALEEVERHGEPMKLAPEQRELIENLADEEHEHLEALTAELERLEGKPVKEGRYFFSYLNPYGVFQIAERLEKAAVGAYNGVIPLIKSTKIRELACSIVQVEGRHAATVRLQNGEPPAPTAFDADYTQLQALNSIEEFTGPAIYRDS